MHFVMLLLNIILKGNGDYTKPLKMQESFELGVYYISTMSYG